MAEDVKLFLDRMREVKRHRRPKMQEPIYETRIRAYVARRRPRAADRAGGSWKWFVRLLTADFSDHTTMMEDGR